MPKSGMPASTLNNVPQTNMPGGHFAMKANTASVCAANLVIRMHPQLSQGARLEPDIMQGLTSHAWSRPSTYQQAYGTCLSQVPTSQPSLLGETDETLVVACDVEEKAGVREPQA